ncbi:hypothetical protein SME22J_21410 [Serratia marcescens]|nr:hypothetical protein SME22J_21410 [Serratia marcescens]BEO42710.1 hypothetical protein SMQE13_20610 [Serratia marcescens]
MRKVEIYAIIAAAVVLTMLLIMNSGSDISAYP